MKQDLEKEIVMGEGVQATLEGPVLKVKGPKGEVERNFLHPKIVLEIKDNKIVFHVKKATKKEKKEISSFASHTKNMVEGVVEPHVYKLKICSGHFPMNVAVSGRELVIKNFLGESVPRKVLLPEGVDVKINGTEIVVSSPNKESSGHAAAKIESLCRITDRDRRIFQDGVYIIHKSGKDI